MPAPASAPACTSPTPSRRPEPQHGENDRAPAYRVSDEQPRNSRENQKRTCEKKNLPQRRGEKRSVQRERRGEERRGEERRGEMIEMIRSGLPQGDSYREQPGQLLEIH